MSRTDARRRCGADRLAWAVALYFGIQSMAFYIGLAWLPSFLADDGGYCHAAAGLLQALGALVSIPAAFLVPGARRRGAEPGADLAAIADVSRARGARAAGGRAGAAPLWMAVLGLGQGGALGLALMLPVLRGGESGDGGVADRDDPVRRLPDAAALARGWPACCTT